MDECLTQQHPKHSGVRRKVSLNADTAYKILGVYKKQKLKSHNMKFNTEKCKGPIHGLKKNHLIISKQRHGLMRALMKKNKEVSLKVLH